jgi:hypothetical protein
VDALMAEEKADKPKGVKPSFTTLRVYESDGEDISELAGLEKKTAADVYREYCAPVIRKLLKSRMEARLKKLNG